VELDVEATIAKRCRQGLAGLELCPRRYNLARFLLLVDCQGSMAPFIGYVDAVLASIGKAGRPEESYTFYFHDVPVEGASPRVLEPLFRKPARDVYPRFDAVLADIPPLLDGIVYRTSARRGPVPWEDVVHRHAAGAGVVIISDAGAVHGLYDQGRLLDTLSCLRALRTVTPHIAWINPLEPPRWKGTTAARLARHIPMFPLTRQGMETAVGVLRGHPHPLEAPL
jgi:uncharacterized protein with von Willebrand factor type A (vWA) domain